MKHIFGILMILVLVFSCTNGKVDKQVKREQSKFKEIIKTEYELCIPNDKTNAVLILFGGFPENAVDIRREFKILEPAIDHKIAVVFMSYNQKLWLEEDGKIELSNRLQNIFVDHKLPSDRVHIGGFSSGGNVSLLISDYLIESDHPIQPKGVFIVDSPIDLLALYRTAIKNIEYNFSEPSVQESTWLKQRLEEKFGTPEIEIKKIERFAPFTSETNHIQNISNLMSTKIRLYTEPDTVWWKTNRMNGPEDLNAFYIKRLSEELTKSFDGNSNIEFIPTKNRGYRANGDRHPHSWSIVAIDDFVQWILKE